MLHGSSSTLGLQTESFLLIDQRLVDAACARHTDFSNDCGVCVRRYFLALIDETYVPLHVHEDTTRKLHAAEATVASLRVELQSARAQRQIEQSTECPDCFGGYLHGRSRPIACPRCRGTGELS